MKYCSQCLQPDTRPGTVFSSQGVCPACEYAISSRNINWRERKAILEEIVRDVKIDRLGKKFDCIIGISGGKDSTRQALFVRDKLGLKPLLVCLAAPPEQITGRGCKNISNLIKLGFDVFISSPAPGIWKSLKLHGFDKFVNSFRSTELALFCCVPQVAIRYEIPLIFWGENPALQVGDSGALGQTGYDGNAVMGSNTLSSGHSWMLTEGFQYKHILPYIYPQDVDLKCREIKIVYLGWFWRNWSNINNAMISCAYGLTKRTDNVTKNGDLYGITALDEDFTPVNQLIKYYKFGFGRVSDYVNEAIRLGQMTRGEGIEIVENFDDCLDQSYIERYCNYLNISIGDFWNKVISNLNRDLFSVSEDLKIKKKFKVGTGII